MKLELPRGMRDLEPQDYELHEKVRQAFLDVARIFGFRIMEPSPIEMLTTLEAKSGPMIRDEIYCFEDKSGRSVGLRFDLTVGLTRFIVSRRDIPLPTRLGAYSGMWRYDEPQYGRYRWFYQWDAEIFGSSSVEADAEIIEFTSALFNKLGLPEVAIEIGDRRSVEEFIRRRLKIADEKTVLNMLRSLDKLSRQETSAVMKEAASKGIREDAMKRLVDFARVKGEPSKAISLLEEEGLQSAATIGELADSLRARDLKKFIVNMGIVRGLDYYTGIVFEAYDDENRDVGSLAGGGRYDILPKAFGRPDLEATGVAGGVERTLIALSKRRYREKEAVERTVYVAYVGAELRKPALTLCAQLRRKGIRSLVELSEKRLGKQLEEASKLGFTHVVIFGPREYASNSVRIKELSSGLEKVVLLKEVANQI